MADLMVRRGGGAQGGSGEVDPFRMMREQVRRMQDLFRFDPFAELEPGVFGGVTAFIPDFEVRDTPDGIVFLADLPGVTDDDLDITVVGNRLRISGKREQERVSEGDTWYAAERSYGNFTRSFVLPEGVDTENVNAKLENGVLKVCVSKHAAAQPRRITLEQSRQVPGQQPAQAFGQPSGYGQQGYGQQQSGQGYPQEEQPEKVEQPTERVPEKV